MIEIGRLVVKTAGRDACKKGVIVDILDDKFVLVDGETRRRKVNFLHIEPLNQVIKIEKNSSHEAVSKALKEIGLEARATKPKPKTERPRAKRKTPEQLRVQKVEKRKLRDLFSFKKKEEKEESKEATLEEKAGLAEEKEETKETKTAEEPKESKPKEKKTAAPKKIIKKKE